jgi:CRP-like cAMP-binding protein
LADLSQGRAMATGHPSGDFANIILAKLSRACVAELRPHLERVELQIKKTIYEPNQRIKDVYFVELGMISIVSIMTNGDMIEVGTIGREGMAGGLLLLGVESIPYQYFVQIAGHGYRMGAKEFKNVAGLEGELHSLVLRYQVAFQTQTMQCAACNGLHSIQQRCCRWILMSQDRVNSNVVPLTQEFLGLMLGVRRASVTDVLQPLQERGLIQCKRGVITVLDRKALESGSCECYRIIMDQHYRMLG